MKSFLVCKNVIFLFLENQQPEFNGFIKSG